MSSTTAGWPEDWSERKAGAGCPMCAGMGSNHDGDHSLFVATLKASEVRLERRSRLPGYCIVIWRDGHVAEPTDLDITQSKDYWADVTAVARAVEAEFRPVKLNLLTLGNWVPHLHTHVVPRYVDDPAPGGPIAWTEMFSAEPIDPGELRRQAAGIRDRLAEAAPADA